MTGSTFETALQGTLAGTLAIGELILAASARVRARRTARALHLKKVWIKSTPKHPHFSGAHFNSSALDTRAGENESATAELKKAVALTPDFIPAYINLGGLLERSGSP